MDQLVVNFVNSAASLPLCISLLGILHVIIRLLILIRNRILVIVFQELAMLSVTHLNLILRLDGKHVLEMM